MPYHINDEGKTGLCRAQAGNCPYGSEDDHYPSEHVARAVYEVSMADYGLPAHQRTRRFESLDSFLQEAKTQDPEPYEDIVADDLPPSMGISPARFGMKAWPDKYVDGLLQVPHQADSFWDDKDEMLINPEDYDVCTAQEVVRYGGVRHYTRNPDEALDEYTEFEGIAVRAILTPENAILVQEGNHRFAAALIAKRPIRVILATPSEVQDYSRSTAQLDLLPPSARTFTASPDPTDLHFPGRAHVTARSWDEEDSSYSPNHYVTPKIAARINAGRSKNVDPEWHDEWADEEQWANGEKPRMSPAGLPLNPAGRTGLTGLGGCKRLGENKAADPVITRNDPKSGKLQVLLGYKDTESQWAIPGGSVDEGEDPADACSRELYEEVGLRVDMRQGPVVYQGLVDDHRNTDNAWFSTQARHVHLNDGEAKQEPVASDDISAARWVEVDSLEPSDLFASHGKILELAGLFAPEQR